MDLFICALRQFFLCGQRCSRLCGCNKYVKKEIPPSKLPWFWIGAQRENSTDHYTVTDLVNTCVKYNNRVDVSFLEEITGLKNATWSYIDSETLVQKNFPSEGFLIES
jgi:hypothetical protein